MEKCYSTDLSDDEWECLELLVPAPNKRGRPRTHGTREILNAIFYVLKSGCPWRLLPKDFPPWETVYWWFGRWRLDGTFERLNAALCERVRSRLGRNPLPTAGCADVDPRMSCMHNRLIRLFGGTVCMRHAIRVNHIEIRCRQSIPRGRDGGLPARRG